MLYTPVLCIKQTIYILCFCSELKENSSDISDYSDLESHISLLNKIQSALVTRQTEVKKLERDLERLKYDLKIRDEHVKLLQDTVEQN